jgi:hypothetical protein
MSFTNETIKQIYNGDGSTTTFAIPFYNLPSNPTFIEVYLLDSANAESLQVITTNYTLSPDNINPANVVFSVAPTASQRVLITRKLPLTQPTSFSNTGPFQKEDYEKSLDKLIMQVQQINEKVDRAVLHSRGSGYSGKSYPVPTANNIPIWDGLGNLVNYPVTNFVNGTYTGTMLNFNTFNLTSGTLSLDGSAFSSIYCSGVSAKTINLPTATTAGAGRTFLIYSDGQSLVTTINRAGADTIEGVTSFSMNVAYKWVMFVSDGVSTWHHNVPKQQEITSAMYADSSISAAKWVLTNAASQTTGFTTTNFVGYYPCNTTSGSFTCTLVSALSFPGKVYTIENTGTANVLTIDPNGSQTIDGYLTYGLHPGERITVTSDGANWRILSLQSRYVNLVSTGVKTPAGNDHWHAQTSNSFTLQPGVWRIDISAFFNNGGTTPAYTFVGANLFAANGTDSGSLPAALSTVSNLTIRSSTFAGNNTAVSLASAATAIHFITGGYYIVECTAVSGTIHLVTYSTQTTAANARVSAAATITRMGG